MRGNILLFAAIALLAVIGSVLLIPGEQELAVMRYRVRQFEDARAMYERQLAAGNMSLSTVKPLAEIYLHSGEIERAVALLERYLAADPDNAEVLERLKQYYWDAQRREDYRVVLTRLARVRPTQELLRELIRELDFTARWDGMVEALELLATRRWANADDYDLLARLLAARDLRGSALAALDELEGRDPAAIEAPTAALAIDLAISLAGAEQALPRARRWLDGNPDPRQAMQIAGAFAQARRPDLSVQLLRPYAGVASDYPELLTALVAAETAVGNGKQARALLVEARSIGRLPSGLEIAYVDALVDAGKLDLAIAEAEAIGFERMSRRLLRGLVEQALRASRPQVAQALVDRLGPELLNRRPTLGAELALAQGDKAAAQGWIERAERRQDLTIEDRLALARVLVQVGRAPDALVRLATLARAPGTPEAAFGDLASLYLELGRAADGLALFVALRRDRPNAAIDAGWARLAAGVGRSGEVLAWLAGGAEPARDVLAEISAAARAAAAATPPDPAGAALALLAAGRLMQEGPTPDDKLRYAEALLVNRRAAEAVAVLEPLLPGSEAVEVAYAAALSANGQGATLAGYWARRLSDPALGPERRAELVYGLLDLKAYAVALPALRGLAGGPDPAWLYAYADAARNAGAVGELGDFLVEQLDRPGIGKELREAQLFLLTEAVPERAAQALAARARAQPQVYGEAYAELLAGLGRRSELVTYLSERLGEPTLAYETRSTMVYRLLDLGAFDLALGPLEALARARGGEWVYALADAAGRAGQPERLASFLTAELDRADLAQAEREARVFLLTERAPQLALATFAGLASRDPERWGDAYLGMLQQLKRREDMVAFLKAELERSLPPAKRDARLYALIEVGGQAAALPFMRRLAEAGVGQWGFAYEEALQKLGRRDDLKRFWLARATRPEVPTAMRRDLAFRLLQASFKPEAETAFRELARTEPPDGENARQLLYLWGPRPDPARLDWVEARARSAQGADRNAWAGVLTQLGAPRRTIALYESAPSPALLDGYIAALAAVKDRTRLTQVLGREIDTAVEPRRLHALADLALGDNQVALAERAWTRVLERAPDEPAALRQLGRYAYFDQRRGPAERNLRRYLELEEGDWETNFFLGEMLQDRQRGEAAGYFRRALDAMARERGSEFGMRLTRAKILFRLGRELEAVEAFETLAAERPRDRALQGEFAAVLIETKRLDRAAQVLAARE